MEAAVKYIRSFLGENELESLNSGVTLHSTSDINLKEQYEQGKFVFAYYKAEREFKVEQYKNIFEDDNLKLQFNDETFQFSIVASDRDSFDFNTMSSGYTREWFYSCKIFLELSDILLYNCERYSIAE